MRLFIAIELPDAVRQHLADFRNHIDDALVVGYGLDTREHPVSHTRPENLHVTLKFLGEVTESAASDLTGVLKQVSLEGPAKVWASHAELLPPRGPIRVVSVGLDGDVGRVAKLHEKIQSACAEQGFEVERRSYLPHVTLARPRRPLPAAARRVLEERLAKHLPGPAFDVSGFALFESRLGSGPPQYLPLARFGG